MFIFYGHKIICFSPGLIYTYIHCIYMCVILHGNKFATKHCNMIYIFHSKMITFIYIYMHIYDFNASSIHTSNILLYILNYDTMYYYKITLALFTYIMCSFMYSQLCWQWKDVSIVSIISKKINSKSLIGFGRDSNHFRGEHCRKHRFFPIFLQWKYMDFLIFNWRIIRYTRNIQYILIHTGQHNVHEGAISRVLPYQ